MANWITLMEQMVDDLSVDQCMCCGGIAPQPCLTHRPTGPVVTPDADQESGCPDGFDLDEWYKQLDDADQE